MDEQQAEPDGYPGGTRVVEGEVLAERTRRRRRRGTVVAAVVAAGLVGATGVAQAAASHGVLATLTGSGSTVAATADDAVVNIVSTDAYAGNTSAGTGMIISATGAVLTNNHVIDGATSITVTIARTGASYRASVVGTAPAQDVAVIQLAGAGGLRTVPWSNETVRVGQRVVASGNAGGRGGAPSAVTGTVTGLDRSITATSGDGGSEQLSGLIETDAAIVAGDSGGPLATTAGKVIGMNTAAAATNGSPLNRGTNDGYAIPIRTAMRIADQIGSGRASDTVHLGRHGFLGVQLQATRRDGFGSGDTGGATIAGVIPGGAADLAGLRAGATITAVDGEPVAGAEDLSRIMAATRPGQRVTVTWTDGYGDSTVGVTLSTAPAD